jgi:hypothetical protein
MWRNIVELNRQQMFRAFFFFFSFSFFHAFSSVVRQTPVYNSHRKDGTRPAIFPINLTTLGSSFVRLLSLHEKVLIIVMQHRMYFSENLKGWQLVYRDGIIPYINMYCLQQNFF